MVENTKKLGWSWWYLQIPLLADISKKISKAYGGLVEDELDELYGASLRRLFIIDSKDILKTM